MKKNNIKQVSEVDLMKKRGKEPGSKCPECNGVLTKQKDLVLVRGKTFTKNVMLCKKCGETYSDLFELERLQKLVRPSIVDRVKSFFVRPTEIKEVNLFKGKIL